MKFQGQQPFLSTEQATLPTIYALLPKHQLWLVVYCGTYPPLSWAEKSGITDLELQKA